MYTGNILGKQHLHFSTQCLTTNLRYIEQFSIIHVRIGLKFEILHKIEAKQIMNRAYSWNLFQVAKLTLSFIILTAQGDFAQKKKALEPCHIGIHLIGLSDTFQMNTNVTGFQW